MPVDWNEHDYSPPDFDRETALQERSHERQHQIALRRWQYPWGSLPESPIDLPDHLAASEAAEPGDDDGDEN